MNPLTLHSTDYFGLLCSMYMAYFIENDLQISIQRIKNKRIYKCKENYNETNEDS